MINIKHALSKLLTKWFRVIFPHLGHFRGIKQNLDCIVLGGNGASQFYQKTVGFTPKIADLTVNPTSISYMYRILKNYHSYLSNDGEIVLILHPFSLCINHYVGNDLITKDIRFYPILHNALIEKYDINLSKKWSRSYKPSSLYDFFQLIRLSFHYTLRNEIAIIHKILKENVDEDFCINRKLSKIVNDNTLILNNIKEFSDERGYHCKILVMKDILNEKLLKQYGTLLEELCYGPLCKTNISILQ